MGKLIGTRVYLAGAIDRIRDMGRGWRKEISEWLVNRGVVVLNPLEKPIKIGIENTENLAERKVWKRDEHFDLVADHMKAVRCVDLRMVDISDFLIVNIDLNTHPCGTYEEVSWANRCKKPVIIYCEQGKTHIPDWLFGMIPHELMFSSLEEVIQYLDSIDSGRDKRDFKRWMFFDLAAPTLFSLLISAKSDDKLKKMIYKWLDEQ